MGSRYFVFIGKLHLQMMGIEAMTSPSTLLLQRKEVSFELEFIS